MKIMAVMAGIWLCLAKRVRQNHRQIPKSISDHLARDMGMTPADLERHRFVWPSQSQDRPNI